MVELCCPIMCSWVPSSVLRCPLRFPHKTMFGSYFTSSYLRYFCLLSIVASNTYWAVFLFCLSSSWVLCTLCCQFLWIPHFWLPLWYSPTFIVPAHWNNSPRIDMSFHSDTLSWFRANQCLLLVLNAGWLAAKQQIPVLYSLIWHDRALKPRFDTTGPWNQNLLHSRRSRKPLHHRCGSHIICVFV